MGNDKRSAQVRIYNPFLDALFNPAEKSPLRNTINELALAHTDFVIFVPPAAVLHNCTDFSQLRLVDLCYTSEDFIRSHIIKTTSALSAQATSVTKQQLLIYSSVNGKQILLKNKAVFTGKGFKKSLRVRVLSVGQFVPFSPVFPTGCSFSVIYIEASLYGPQPAIETPAKDVMSLTTPNPLKLQQLAVTFEDLLRKFPILSKTMLPGFYALFHHNNREFQALRNHRKPSLAETKHLFGLLVQRATQIVQNSVNADSPDGDRVYHILQSLSAKNPGLDMAKLLHEYVELNMYDQIWLLLVSQYKDVAPGEQIDDPETPKTVLTHALYRELSCLSLNQLDIPVTDPWDLNILHKRVADAIKVFATLSGPNVTNQRQKIAIIKDTVLILTADSANAFSGPVIDADTLIGLLIMVVVHSKVPNLECHLFYIRNFGLSHQKNDSNSGSSSAEEDLGFMSYILSNIEAVIYHLHDSGDKHGNGHLVEMTSASAKNYMFWLAILKQSISELEEFFDSVEAEFKGKALPKHHVLHSRNINGESCFHLAIRTRNIHVFSMLLTRTEEWILLEDLIFDKNTSTNQNLLMTALQEEVPEIISMLIEMFLSSATPEEQVLYFNAKDNNGRSVGHYLSHDLTALNRLGGLIDWEAKDLNSHTPLFSICRSYDHPLYEQLVAQAFGFVLQARPAGLVSFDSHTDKAGNTLLHALARAIPESGILSDERVLVNVNKMNLKGITPAALYVRYGRVDNLKHIFQDPRIIFDIEEPKYSYNLMDYYSFSAGKSLNVPNEEFLQIEALVANKYFGEYYPRQNTMEVGFFNARFDGVTNDWAINTFHCRKTPAKTVASKYISLHKLRQFYKLYWLVCPMSFIPNEGVFWMNYDSDKPTVPICSKYKTNRMLEHLTMLFALSNYLRPDARKLLMRAFARCCKDEVTLDLDLESEISIIRDSARNAVGEVTLSEPNIQEIRFFVEFSIADLTKYKTTARKLNQMATLAAIGQNDVRNVTDQFFRNIHGLGTNLSDDIADFRLVDGSYAELQKHAEWIELCADEMLSKCNQIVDKTRVWQDTYARIKLLNADLHKYENNVAPHAAQKLLDNSGVPSVPDVPGGEQGVDTNGHHSLSRRNTLSLEDLPSDDDHETESSFFNFGLIDSKKSRYRKLVLAKAEEVKQLMDLNVDIKLGHEMLAAEMSQFLEYRSGVLKFGIRQFTRKSLVLLRNRTYELSKLLYESRRMDRLEG